MSRRFANLFTLSERMTLTRIGTAGQPAVTNPRRSPGPWSIEVSAVLATAKGDRLEALWILGFVLGMRPGELTGLRWDHVDFDTGVITVWKSLKHRKGEVWQGDTKTPGSHRKIGALRNPHLRCAADSYDRAARAQYGRLPRRSGDGDQLRRTARMIALAGNLTGDATLTAIALVAQLVALAAAVAELRQAQQHAAQSSSRPRRRPPALRHDRSAVTGAAFRACTVVADLQGGRSRAQCSP